MDEARAAPEPGAKPRTTAPEAWLLHGKTFSSYHVPACSGKEICVQEKHYVVFLFPDVHLLLLYRLLHGRHLRTGTGVLQPVCTRTQSKRWRGT